MNIIPKANPQDVAGVFGLMAFLADKDACMARLKELQDAVAATETEQISAGKMKADAEAALKTAVDRQNSVDEAMHKAVEVKVAQQTEGARLQAMGIELSDREARVKSIEVRLAAQDAAQKATRAELSKLAAAIEADRIALTEKEAAHEEKLAKLRSITG